MRWQCPNCDHLQVIDVCRDKPIETCGICGNHELYKKKNFPHWLGMAILAAASLGFIVLNGLYLPWVAWVVLLGSAAIDGLLYLTVGDALVCYRCGAQFSGQSSLSSHAPFELVIAERYRQERIRRSQM
jgi:hypothetical protein